MKFIKQDITTISEPAVIAHGVNCQGRMGSGVALALCQRWPSVKHAYEETCSANEVAECAPGLLLGQSQPVRVTHRIVVVNCFTQVNYGYDGQRYACPDAVFNSLMDTAHFWMGRCTKLHIPRIGCTRGGLDWSRDVYPKLCSIEALYHPVEFIVHDLP